VHLAHCLPPRLSRDPGSGLSPLPPGPGACPRASLPSAQTPSIRCSSEARYGVGTQRPGAGDGQAPGAHSCQALERQPPCHHRHHREPCLPFQPSRARHPPKPHRPRCRWSRVSKSSKPVRFHLGAQDPRSDAHAHRPAVRCQGRRGRRPQPLRDERRRQRPCLRRAVGGGVKVIVVVASKPPAGRPQPRLGWGGRIDAGRNAGCTGSTPPGAMAYATAVQGKPGYVTSPHAPQAGTSTCAAFRLARR
jgi:hypothetical protein